MENMAERLHEMNQKVRTLHAHPTGRGGWTASTAIVRPFSRRPGSFGPTDVFQYAIALLAVRRTQVVPYRLKVLRQASPADPSSDMSSDKGTNKDKQGSQSRPGDCLRCGEGLPGGRSFFIRSPSVGRQCPNLCPNPSRGPLTGVKEGLSIQHLSPDPVSLSPTRPGTGYLSRRSCRRGHRWGVCRRFYLQALRSSS